MITQRCGQELCCWDNNVPVVSMGHSEKQSQNSGVENRCASGRPVQCLRAWTLGTTRIPTLLSCSHYQLGDLGHVSSPQALLFFFPSFFPHRFLLSVKVGRCILKCKAWEKEQTTRESYRLMRVGGSLSYIQKCKRAFLTEGIVHAETLRQAVARPVAETAEGQCV